MRFFYFNFILFFTEGQPLWGNKFVKSEGFPPFEWLDGEIIKDYPDKPIKQVFINNWKEMSMKDYFQATGQPLKGQKIVPAKIPLAKL